MKVDVQGLINQLTSLEIRLRELRDRLDELDGEDEETIEIWELEKYMHWADSLNIAIACDGLKQAYLDEEDKKDDQ